MDPDSSPPLPPHVQKERDDMDARIDMGRMIDEARKSVNERSPTGSPGSINGSPGTKSRRARRQTIYPVGGKRRTKKTCGGKRRKKSKTSKKRGHKKSKTHKKRSHKKRA